MASPAGLLGRLSDLTALFEYWRGRLERARPLILRLCITNRCNAKCPFCSFTNVKDEEIMSLANFTTILDKAGQRIQLVDFAFSGEPLLNRHLPAMIRLAKGRHLDTILHTNGRCFDRERIEGLVASGIDFVVINLNAIARDYRLQSPGDLLDGYVSRVNEYLRANAGSRTLVALQVINTTGARGLELRGIAQRFVRAENCMIQLKPEGDYTYETKSSAPGESIRCYRLYQEIAVEQNGDVVLCCCDTMCRIKLGNLLEQDLQDIWVERLNQVRERNTFGLCQGCEDNRIGAAKMVANVVLSPLTSHTLYSRTALRSRVHAPLGEDAKPDHAPATVPSGALAPIASGRSPRS